MLTRVSSATSGRGFLWIAAALLAAVSVVAGAPPPAHALDEAPIKVKVGGKLAVPASAPLGVIATDPVLQQVLSQDLGMAGRLAGPSATSALTLTATLTRRVLEPGMSLDDVVPGDPHAAALLKAAGVTPIPPPDALPRPPGGPGQPTAAQGNAGASNDIQSYEREGQETAPGPAPMGPMMGAPMGVPMGPMGPMMGGPMGQLPVPPATAQERSALPPYMGAAAPYQPTTAGAASESGANYDTVFVARATLGSGGGTLTVVAVAHPGYNSREVRKLIAEEIANAVLH